MQTTSPELAQFAGKRREEFTHVVEFLGLPANGNSSRQLTVDASADFIITAVVRVATDAADVAAVDFCPATVRVKNTSTGADMSSAPVHIEGFAGTARQPAYLPVPVLVPRGSTLTVDVATKAAAPQNVRLYFVGYKVAA